MSHTMFADEPRVRQRCNYVVCCHKVVSEVSGKKGVQRGAERISRGSRPVVRRVEGGYATRVSTEKLSWGVVYDEFKYDRGRGALKGMQPRPVGGGVCVKGVAEAKTRNAGRGLPSDPLRDSYGSGDLASSRPPGRHGGQGCKAAIWPSYLLRADDTTAAAST